MKIKNNMDTLLLWGFTVMAAFYIGMQIGGHHTQTAINTAVSSSNEALEMMQQLRECRRDSLQYRAFYMR